MALNINEKMKEKILKSLNLLKERRPIFHSEDDFKFSFSKALSDVLSVDYEIRLERPVYIKMMKRNGPEPVRVRAPIDIVIINTKTNSNYPIELKYKTKKFQINDNKEEYILADQNAQDEGRFYFRKDIYRVEHLLDDHTPQGFFIVITNDETYLKDISEKKIIASNFSFHQGAILMKEANWNYDKQFNQGYSLNKNNMLMKDGKKHWTTKGDFFYQLNLQQTYNINWEIYSVIANQTFHYSIVDIS